MAFTKIATCCYCGTKAALVLRGNKSHELTCGKCGAPLRAMKMLPKQAVQQSPPPSFSTRPKKRQRNDPDQRSGHQKKRKKSRSIGRRFMSEFWDAVEDVVDDIFD